VLECLIDDCYGADEEFKDWAETLGYDTDSIKARTIYKAVVAQTKKLRALLGDGFDTIADSIDE